MLAPITIGVAGGIGYFALSESGVPKEANCSYLAPASTDVLAALAGALLVWQGGVHQAPLVSGIGATVLSIHAAQWWSHKRNVE